MIDELTSKSKLKKPKLYKVLILNDDVTPMDYVVLILKECFFKSDEEANALMLKVHEEGAGLCGVYTKDIAASKVFLVNENSLKNNYTLKCIMESD